MSIKRKLSKLLTLTILLASIPLTSFAGLDPDSTYFSEYGAYFIYATSTQEGSAAVGRYAGDYLHQWARETVPVGGNAEEVMNRLIRTHITEYPHMEVIKGSSSGRTYHVYTTAGSTYGYAKDAANKIGSINAKSDSIIAAVNNTYTNVTNQASTVMNNTNANANAVVANTNSNAAAINNNVNNNANAINSNVSAVNTALANKPVGFVNVP